MPEFESVVYTVHARTRMRKRRIPESEVERVLRFGEGRPDRRGQWIYEFDGTRVVIVESQSIARVITVVRLRGKR
jgi:Domain of unknown function (DUF4258)